MTGNCEQSIKETKKRMEAARGLPFIAALVSEIQDRLGLNLSPDNPDAIIESLLNTLDKDDLQKWIYAIREALEHLSKSGDSWTAQWKAASALFYMTVRQLINHPPPDSTQSEFVRKIMKFSTDDPHLPQIIGAVIAAALLGGKLEFDGTGRDRTPEHVHVLRGIAPRGEDYKTPIAQALFKAWFPAHESATKYSDGAIPLSPTDMSRLKQQIKHARHQKYKTVAYIVDGDSLNIQALEASAKKFEVPLLWQQESKVMEEILGINPGELLEDIRLFWDIDTGTSKQSDQQASTPRAPTTPTKQVLKFYAPAAVALGDHNNVGIGIDAETLNLILSHLHQLQTSIPEDGTQQSRNFRKLLKKAEAEVNAATPDKSNITKRIGNIIEKIKEAPEYIEGGQAIATAFAAICALLS